MLKHSYPGVYVREEKSGVNTISGAATSVAAFFGTAPKGPIDEPVRVFNYDGFESVFGSEMTHGEMPLQVRQFFMNGGGTAWITRIADGATTASIDLTSIDSATECMTVTTKEVGAVGNMVRFEVDYNTINPERFFNITAYNFVHNPGQAPRKEAVETFVNLSMEPEHGRFVETIVNRSSALINVAVSQNNIDATPNSSFLGSTSGWIFAPAADVGGAEDSIYTFIQTAFPNGGSVQLSLDGQPSLDVPILPDFAALPAASQNFDGMAVEMVQAVTNAIDRAGLAGTIEVEVNRVAAASFLTIKSAQGKSVEISSSSVNDCAGALKLGVANGGIECDRTTNLRPPPSGVSSNPHDGTTQDLQYIIDLIGETGDNFTWSFLDGRYAMTTNPLVNGSIFVDAPVAAPIIGSFEVLSQNIALIAGDMNAETTTAWSVSSHGLRIHLTPVEHTPAYGANVLVTQFSGTNAYPGSVNATTPVVNTASYNMTAGTIGSDGNVPTPGHYSDAYDRLVKDSDIFNIVVLPRCQSSGSTQSDAQRANLWGPISAKCQKSRSFLIMDPPGDDASVWNSANSVDAGIQGMRTGVVGDHAAIYWPKVKVSDDLGNEHVIDPSGSVAGIYARTDSTRGVWKAPAGLGATFTGIRGLEHQLTDDENGVTNLAAVNTNRQFSQGAVSWGARTLAGFENSGESDWNYVPVRRLALMIEESLYRGLKFAVFEPNDEPLWAQIRMAGGAFMNNLFRQGAFKGSKSTDAYYVRCDASTTTQNDINLGVVNVRVGFAPLKPAEFVEIVLRQMAGQVEV